MSIAATQPVCEPSTPRASLERAWPEIRALWQVMPVAAFATVGPDGSPEITPIGSVYLDPQEPKGYYHPIFASRLRRNLAHDGRFELLFLDLRTWTWLSSLVRGRFKRLVAARLRGRAAGARRPATQEESERWQGKVGAVRWTRGHELLWKDVRYVQELSFDDYVPVRFGAMPHGEAAPRRAR